MLKKKQKKAGSEYIATHYIIFGILNTGGVGIQAIRNFDIDTEELTEKIKEIISIDESDEKKELRGFIPAVERLLKSAEKYSSELNQKFIETGHFLLGSLAEKCGLAEMLLTYNPSITKEKIRKELTSLLTTGKSSLPSIILDASGMPYAK